MKKILLLIILLACIGRSGKAQSGASCATARPYFTDTSFVAPFKWQTKQLQWFQFTALSDTLDIGVRDINMFSATDKVIAIYLLKGNCGSISLVASDTIDSSIDSVLNITGTLVIPDSNYYLVVLKQDTTSTINYLLGMSFRILSCVDPTSTPCDYIFNGDFEYNSYAPLGPSQIYLACPWNYPTLFMGTSDYFSAASTPASSVQAPYTSYGIQSSISPGIAFAGFDVYTPGAIQNCEYIYQMLNYGGLVAGNRYDLSMWVNLDSTSRFGVNNIGFSLTTASPLTGSSVRIIASDPSLLWSAPVTATGYGNWYHIFFNNYLATANYKYVTIGCFDTTITTSITNPTGSRLSAYYFVDNVSIIPSTNPFTVTTTSATCLGDSISLTTNSSQVVRWSSSPASTFSCDSCASTIATPSVTGSTMYVANLSAAGCILSDTVIVSVDSCTSNSCGIVVTDTLWDNTFSSTIVPHAVYNINHNVHVASGSTVSLSGDVFSISPNITITVDAGATLTLLHCHLYACDTMWQGIVVSPDGHLNIYKNCLIEDAEIAVDITNNTSPSPTTTLNVGGAIFNKNDVSINIVNDIDTVAYPFIVTGTVFTSRKLPYTPASWTTPGALKTLVNTGTTAEHYNMGNYPPVNLAPPNTSTRSNIGIVLVNVGTRTGTFPGPYAYYDMTIGDGNSNGALNLFDTLRYGIVAVNSNITCYNNTFQYILDPSTFGPSGYGIYSLYTTPVPSDEFATENRLRVISDTANSKWGNRFYDCSVGIYSNYYNDVTINHCDIRSTEEAITTQPSNGVVGIWVVTPNCSNIMLDSNVITNEYAGIGFFADDYTSYPGYTDAQLIENVHITDNTIQPTYGTTAPTNEYCYYGIIAQNLFDWYGAFSGGTPGIFPGIHQVNVNRNHIHNLHNGIEMINWLNWQPDTGPGFGNIAITNRNYITLRQVIFPPSVGSPQYGIAHILDWRPVIDNNNITGYGYNDIDSVSTGIMCAYDVAPRFHQEVMCNYVDTTGNGIYFLGSSPVMTGQGYNYVANNEMKSCGKGLVIDDTYIGNQGDNTYASDNVWTPYTYGNAGQYTTYTRNGADPTLSWLYTEYGSPWDPSAVGACWSDLGIPFSYQIGNGITDSSGSNGVTCNTASSIGMYSGNNNKSLQHTTDTTAILINKLELMVEDSVKYSYFETEQHISDKFKVYQMLSLQPSLKNNSSILSRFYNTSSTSNIGKIQNAAIALSTGQLQNAAALLNSVVPQNAIERNNKNYYSVYLHYVMKTNSQSDSVMLKALAMGCPVRDGLIVWHARMLYSKIYRDFTNYPNDCIDPNNKAKMKQNKKPDIANGLSLFPNPSSGSFTINITGTITTNVVVEISDITGKLISADKVILNDNTAIIDRGLRNGMYFISVKDLNGNNIGSPKKITIIH